LPGWNNGADSELQQQSQFTGRDTMLKMVSVLMVGAAMLVLPAHAQNASKSTTTNQTEQNASATGTWQASKLIGVNVYNGQNEKIGDIKEMMIDKDGKIADVAIGVGGFLGMGEHDVAVKFSELKWSNEPVRSSATSSNANSTQTTGAATSSSSTSNQKKNYPDHAVLDATKDQLKAMPQFNYNK
jgi:sporulation protein YlmC with PRC-barrel domain